jgi:two-component system chemotaxis response regulator CheY
MRNILKDIFVRAGFEVVAEADNGEDVVSLYRQAAPDLVTLDIIMPGRSGLEALRELMAAEPAARVVMVSALGQDALVLEAVEAGARDFIVKPFKEAKVLEVARRVTTQG